MDAVMIPMFNSTILHKIQPGLCMRVSLRGTDENMVDKAA